MVIFACHSRAPLHHPPPFNSILRFSFHLYHRQPANIFDVVAQSCLRSASSSVSYDHPCQQVLLKTYQDFSSSYRTNQMANKRKRQKRRVKILPTFMKRSQDKKPLEVSRIFLKKSTHQMFAYSGLFRFLLGVTAFPKQMRH